MTRRMNYTLWGIQCLLALLYLMTGGLKLILPVAELTKQISLPGGFIRFIGAAEVISAAGLILPGLLRTRQELTPLAATGLLIIMTGATGLLFAHAGAGSALLPMIAGILDAFVARARWGAIQTIRREQCFSQSAS